MTSPTRAVTGSLLSALLSALPMAGWTGCAADSGTSEDTQRDVADPAQEELAPGMQGAAVSELQDYLTSYGYFPNDWLAEQFPDWLPVTSASPKRGVYDDATAAAVRAFQARNGLEATGIAGPSTRALIGAARCGNLDSGEPGHGDKFAFADIRWPAGKRNFTWKVLEPSTCMARTGSGQFCTSTAQCPGGQTCHAGERACTFTCSSSIRCPSGQTCDSARGVCTTPCFSAGVPPPATRQQLRDMANYAFAIWGLETDISFTEISNTSSTRADITINFGDQRGDTPNALATTANFFPVGSSTIAFSELKYNARHPLSPVSPTPGVMFDMWAITVHEMGHFLGLKHSSNPVHPNSVMKPAIPPGAGQPRTLSPDDQAAISTRYDLWNSRIGLARDIGAGADGTVWHIGTAPQGAGFRIYKWNHLQQWWEEASGGGGAVRVAVTARGEPMVVDGNDNVWWHSAKSFEGGWNLAFGKAKDIAVSPRDDVWFVTNTFDNEGPEGGFKIGKAVFEDGLWKVIEVAGPTHAARISVAPDGTPWIVNTLGDVLFRTSNDPRSGTWVHRGGIKASDITVSGDFMAYATGAGPNAGRVYIRVDQPAIPNDSPEPTPDPARWIELARLPSGTPANIAAGRRTAWVTNTANAIYQQTEKFLF